MVASWEIHPMVRLIVKDSLLAPAPSKKYNPFIWPYSNANPACKGLSTTSAWARAEAMLIAAVIPRMQAFGWVIIPL